jgi:PAS domain S-box-containing protein
VSSHCDVLIVDDDPINRRLIEVILGKAGISSVSVATGEEALERALSVQPMVILMDVVMPGMGGFAACQALKANASTGETPVIFVTGNDDVESESRCFEVGGADFVRKPFAAATLLARIKTQIAVSADRRRLEGMFRDVIEYAPVAFVLTDLAGQIVTTNALALVSFGATRGEMIGSPLSQWIPAIATHIELGQSPVNTDQFELDCRRGDGSHFPADIIAGSLRTTKQPLDLFIVRNIEQQRSVMQELRDSRSRLRALGAMNESAREGERKRIAREVHDELGQVMTALRMDLSMLDMLHGEQVPKLRAKVLTMKELVDRAIGGVRQIASNLRPPALDMGLGAAIEWLVSEFKRHGAVEVELGLQGLPDGMQDDRAMTIYRIVQESLNNIAKYAQATRVEVSLRLHGDSLELHIRDNGVGFDPEAVSTRGSFGLLGMHERALSIGSDLAVDSAVGQGTHIHARFPWGSQQEVIHD